MLVVGGEQVGKLQGAAEIGRVQVRGLAVPLIEERSRIAVRPDRPAFRADHHERTGDRQNRP